MYIYKYDGIVREKIIQYKFNEKSYLYRTFAQSIINSEKIFGKFDSYDIITFVPISKNRKNERGYNQSELIAREFNNYKNILIKPNDTQPQSVLTREERKNNIKGAYKVIDVKIIKEKSILLIDDVFTTGATANECSRILMQNGAKNIDILTIAKD